MQFDWWTLVLQIVNFLILVWLLHRFLYKPVQAVIAKRREQTGAALADANAKRAEAEALQKSLEAARAELEASRAAMMDEARGQAEAKREAILDETRRQVDALLAAARDKAAKAREEDIASLRAELAQAATAIALKILSETADGSFDAIFRDKILRKLDELLQRTPPTPAELAAHPLQISTAAPLADAEKRAWADALKVRFADRATPEFSVDPTLIAGAELRLPHGVVRFAWADELRQADQLLATQKAAE